MNNFSKINLKFYCLFSFILVLSLNEGSVLAQSAEPKNTMVQSTFYDAQALYFALQGYNAYPVYNRDVQNAGVNTQEYSIIELTTGKILLDACLKDDLIPTLKLHKFVVDADKVSFINQIFARHVGLSNKNQPAVTLKSAVTPTYTDVESVYTNNKYLNGVLTTNGTYNFTFVTPLDASNAGKTLNVPNAGGALPSTSLNTIVDGLAGFYIDRVNDEINEAFFIRLQDILNKYPELKILFPNTLASLNKIKITDYQQSLNAIKSAYQSDIKNILSNASGLAQLDKYQTLIDNNPPLTLLFVTCDVITMIQKGKSVEDILYQVNNTPYIQLPTITDVKKNDYTAVIKLAAIISNAFIDVKIGDETPTSYKWITAKQISTLKDSPDIFKLFMGLLTQDTYGIKLGDMDIYKSLNDNKDDILKSQFLIYNFSSAATLIAAKIKSVSVANTTSGAALSTKVNLYIDITKQIVNLASVCLTILPTEKVKAQQAIVNTIKTEYVPYLYQVDSVIYHIEKQEYTSAIYSANSLIKTVLDNEIAALQKKIDAKPADDVLKSLNKELKDLTNARDYYLKYGVFIATVAEAQKGDDVKKAIQAFALPIGSSRIKKEHNFSWGINSYVGVYHAWNHNHIAYNLPAEETGITAPMGIGFNFGLPNNIGSISLYGGVIDIGAIFSYKVNTDNSVQSDIKLGQILSPSAGLVYGFPIFGKYNLPLSIGANYQWGPKLKSIDNAGNSVLQLYTSRFNIFIAVDIPIVNFNVSKK